MTPNPITAMAAWLAPGAAPYCAPRAPTRPLPPRTPQFVPGLRAQSEAAPARRAQSEVAPAQRAQPKSKRMSKAARAAACRAAAIASPRVQNSTAELIRRLLQTTGARLTAREIAQQLGLPDGRGVNCALKRDIKRGTVKHRQRRYHWATPKQ